MSVETPNERYSSMPTSLEDEGGTCSEMLLFMRTGGSASGEPMSDGRARLLLLRLADAGSAVRGGGAGSNCDRCRRSRPPLTRAAASCAR